MDRPRVLIVDDEIRMCESLEILLSGHGFDITFFTDGRQALSYLQDQSCDLVLLDLMMPDMDGLNVLTQIKENLPDVQVIIMTAQGSADYAVKAIKQGADDFLCKPFEIDELTKRMHNTLNAKRLSKHNALIEAKLAITEEQFRQAQKMEGHATLALQDLDISHPHYERLKSIEDQVQSGADLTRQLLGFARVGRYDVKPSNMNDIIKRTCSMFGRTKKEISIRGQYGKDLWNTEVDRGQMEQVFMNLFVNAWQAMPGGGEIYLETDNILFTDERAFPYAITPGKYVKVTVTDSGIGMDDKTKERIFDPFFTTKEMGRGTGLGLAMVYGIIKGHKGMINVYSEPGKGATFTIYLPASEKEVVKTERASKTIARGKETILLVDDEKMVLEVSKELLESMGYQIYAVGSGQEAIAVYMEKQKNIDLVILDMIMPGISGGEAFNRLREINPEVKVLLSSGYSREGQGHDNMDRSCNGFLQKPFCLADISQKVREILD
jgi:CheY-like chemotaxis protein